MRCLNKNSITVFCLLLIITSCSSKTNSEKVPSILSAIINTKSNYNSIHILPLGNVSKEVIQDVSSGLSSFYHKEIIIEKAVPLENSLLAKSGKRYSAERILKKFKNSNITLVITEKDIVSKKGNVDEFGIFGLGNQPGKTCVISPFRPRWNSTPQLLKERLQKISIHEIGHNLGLDHCTKNSKCLMCSAKGTIKQVDQEEMFFCEYCRKIIGI